MKIALHPETETKRFHPRVQLLLVVYLFCCSTLSAQWQAYTPVLTDTVGVADLRIATQDDQVAWAFAMKYDVETTGYTALLTDSIWYIKTVDGGNTWTGHTIPMGTEPYASNICAVDSNVAWVSSIDVNFESFIKQTLDGGATWTRKMTSEFTDFSSYVNFVYFWDAANGVAMGDPAPSPTDSIPHYEIYTTTDSGNSWTRVPRSNIPAPLFNEYGMGGYYRAIGNYIWFGTIDVGSGNGRRLMRSRNGGQSWEALPGLNNVVGDFSFSDTLHGINGNRIQSGFYQIYYTINGGNNWITLPLLEDAAFVTSLVLIPESQYILVVLRDNNITGPFRTLLSKDLGQNWLELGNTEHAGWMDFSSPYVGYAGEWQPKTHTTRMYKYAGDPLTGLYSGKELQAKVKIGPNPSRDYVELTIETATPSVYTCLLHDASGRLMARKTADGAFPTLRFEMQNLPAGIYSLTVSNESGFLTQKIVKQ